MEKAQYERPNKSSLVWDCGSTLYDSFELNSLKRQLDSAITSRTLSMPHLPDRRAPPPPPPKPAVASTTKKSSRISRSLHRLLRSVFKSKQTNSSAVLRVQEQSKDGFYVVYDKSGSLTTIPEVPEIDFSVISPEIGSLVRRSTSERFAATSIGISCA